MEEVERYQISPLVCNMIRQNFAGYVGLFHKGEEEYDNHIQLKEEHTGRVCAEIRLLGESQDMSEEELAFIEILAWLHDIGRFEQFDKYGTFADAESEDHTQIAIRVIEKLDLLKHFTLLQQEVIIKTILNHNLPQLSNTDPFLIDYYSRMLRDADKLDIWRVSLEYNIFHKLKTETFPDHYQVPKNMLQCFEESKIIKLKSVDSFYDSILFRLSWIYDLSFPHSFKMVQERDIIPKLLGKLPFSPELERISILSNKYISARVN